jgi:hypothetical protein
MSSSAISGPIFSDNKRAPAGTAAAPSFAFNDSTGTGVYLVSAGVLGLSTAGVQRVVVDASGNVGIGTASPTGQLEISNTSDPTSLFYRLSNGAGVGIGRITWDGQNSSSARASYARVQAEIQTNTAGAHGGALAFYTAGSGAVAERMRIDASGNLLVGTASLIDPNALVNVKAVPAAKYTIASSVPTTSTAAHIYFWNPNGPIGSIQTTGNNTAYNTSSDYRLKEAVKPMTAALSRVAALKPCTYKWKVDGSEGEGFLAHELAEVCPSAVSGEKDAVNGDGSIKSQGIDPSKLVGLLTAAIQELKAELDEAKAKIAALESK